MSSPASIFSLASDKKKNPRKPGEMRFPSPEDATNSQYGPLGAAFAPSNMGETAREVTRMASVGTKNIPDARAERSATVHGAAINNIQSRWRGAADPYMANQTSSPLDENTSMALNRQPAQPASARDDLRDQPVPKPRPQPAPLPNNAGFNRQGPLQAQDQRPSPEGGVDVDRGVVGGKPLQRGAEEGMAAGQDPFMLPQVVTPVLAAQQQMDQALGKQEREMRLRAMTAPRPGRKETIDSELAAMGPLGRLKQVGLGLLRGFAMGGAGGAIAGGILGGTGDMYRSIRGRELALEEKAQQQAYENEFEQSKQADQTDYREEQLMNARLRDEERAGYRSEVNAINRSKAATDASLKATQEELNKAKTELEQINAGYLPAEKEAALKERIAKLELILSQSADTRSRTVSRARRDNIAEKNSDTNRMNAESNRKRADASVDNAGKKSEKDAAIEEANALEANARSQFTKEVTAEVNPDGGRLTRRKQQKIKQEVDRKMADLGGQEYFKKKGADNARAGVKTPLNEQKKETAKRERPKAEAVAAPSLDMKRSSPGASRLGLPTFNFGNIRPGTK